MHFNRWPKSRLGKYMQKHGGMKQGMKTGMHLECLSHMIHVEL